MTADSTNKFTFVVPFKKDLLTKINGEQIVIKSEPSEMEQVFDYLHEKKKNTKSILIDYNKYPISLLPFDKKWNFSEITVMVSEIGSVKVLLENIPTFNELKIRFFLPGSKAKSFEQVRILASLGIHSGIYFDDLTAFKWREFDDLAHYYFKSKVSLAPIEPLSYLKFHYNPEDELNFYNLYFDNPELFLHVSDDENIALRYKDLMHQNFILNGIENTNEILNIPEYQAEIQRKEKIFSDLNECSCCPAWRICQGKFIELDNKHQKCAASFALILDYLENKVKKEVKQTGQEKRWQQ